MFTKDSLDDPMNHDRLSSFTLVYKLPMLPKHNLPFISFRIDPIGVVRKLTRRSTKSPSASAKRILFFL